jgi:hypothetical protein
VLCLSYAQTLLLDVRQTLIKIQDGFIDPASGNSVDLRALSIRDLHSLLCRSDIRSLIDSELIAEPYIQFRTKAILEGLSDPVRYLELLTKHEERIRWQMQRLWRARCDILHSATLTLNGVLLCANLEFYLKSTLMTLLTELRKKRTLVSPEEFFDRCHYLYKRLKESLSKGSVDMLREVLAA